MPREYATSELPQKASLPESPRPPPDQVEERQTKLPKAPPDAPKPGPADQPDTKRDERKRGRLEKKADKDIRPYMQPYAAKGSGSLNFTRGHDGERLNVSGVSEDVVRELAKACLRGATGPVEFTNGTTPKPGEPADVMSVDKMRAALKAAGDAGALVEDIIASATKSVITRDHVQYETYQTRFTNGIRRAAKALLKEGLVLWWARWEPQEPGVKNTSNKKVFGVSTTPPRGVTVVDPL